jgi:hypothetical protein
MKPGETWAAAMVASAVAIAAVAALRMPLRGGGAHAPRVPTPTPEFTKHRVHVMHEPQADASPPTSDATPHDELPLSSWELMATIERTLGSADEVDRDRLFAKLLPALMELDPAAGGRLVENAEPVELRDELRRRVVQTWAQLDAPAALEWVARLSDELERKSTAADLVDGLGRSSPAAAIEVGYFFDVGTQDGALEHRAQLWAAEDPAAAVRWVATQPAGPRRDRMVARIALVHADSQPAIGLQLIDALMSAGSEREEAERELLNRWAARDLEPS